jgi:two-component system chemotaxis sensor kinase CheA
MNLRFLSALAPRFSAGGLVVLVVILAVSFVAIVLIPGLELASELASSTVTLKFVGQQQRNPAVIHASLDSMHDRLTNRGYIQESLDQLRDAAAKLDAGLHDMNAPRPASWFALAGDTGAKGEPIAGRHAAALRELWAKEQESLEPILKFKGVPYQDNESTGTALNDVGKQLERDVTVASRASKRLIPLIDNELTAIVADLQAANARSATELRLVMLTGLLIAVVLAALVTILLLARKRQEASLREARQQTADILRTVKDGLFLLDENLVIGASYSSALESLFQRNDFAGLPFEKLLKNIVSEKTLSTALKFVGVLWSERTKENQRGQRAGRGFHPLFAIRLPSGASRRQDHARLGVGVGCQRPRGPCARASVLSNPGSGAGGYFAGNLARRSGATGFLFERFECRHEDD